MSTPSLVDGPLLREMLHPVTAAIIQQREAIEVEQQAQATWAWENGGKQKAASYAGRSVVMLSSSPYCSECGVIESARVVGPYSKFATWEFTVFIGRLRLRTIATLNDVKLLD